MAKQKFPFSVCVKRHKKEKLLLITVKTSKPIIVNGLCVEDLHPLGKIIWHEYKDWMVDQGKQWEEYDDIGLIHGEFSVYCSDNALVRHIVKLLKDEKLLSKASGSSDPDGYRARLLLCLHLLWD
jgi:hypothetical protein